MRAETWAAFVVAAWLICLSPGPGVLSSITAAIRFGRRGAAWNLVGLQLGATLVLLVVGAGLGAVLKTSAAAFAAVKWFGALYLIWLGVQQWRARAAPLPAGGAPLPEKPTAAALVLRGFLVNASNPKGILFTAAVLPQFIDAQAPALPQYLIVGATLMVCDVICMTGYAALGARALRLLGNAAAQRWTSRGFGGLFIGAGVALAAFKRAP